jgi:hypothetical protein
MSKFTVAIVSAIGGGIITFVAVKKESREIFKTAGKKIGSAIKEAATQIKVALEK